jgi:hypothetical protein
MIALVVAVAVAAVVVVAVVVVGEINRRWHRA